MINNSLLRAIALILIALCRPALAADITVQTDRGTIRMNEAFTLTFSAHGRADGNPDFAPLQQDFEIAGTSQNSSFVITNGQTESSSNWVVTVFPKRAGTLTVPPIAFGSDSSPELKIEVHAGADPGATENKDAFITVETKPGNPYVQAQTIVTLRLYRIPNMVNEQLSQLEFSSSDVILASKSTPRVFTAGNTMSTNNSMPCSRNNPGCCGSSRCNTAACVSCSAADSSTILSAPPAVNRCASRPKPWRWT
jgi:hypothetical protein